MRLRMCTIEIEEEKSRVVGSEIFSVNVLIY